MKEENKKRKKSKIRNAIIGKINGYSWSILGDRSILAAPYLHRRACALRAARSHKVGLPACYDLPFYPHALSAYLLILTYHHPLRRCSHAWRRDVAAVLERDYRRQPILILRYSNIVTLTVKVTLFSGNVTY